MTTDPTRATTVPRDAPDNACENGGRGKSLAGKSVANIIWSYGSFAGSKTINFVSLIILARLLGPEDFGLMAICLAAMAYFEVVSRFGLGAALISRKDDVEAAANAVFYFSIVSSAAMAVAIWLGAPWIGDVFGEPEVVGPLRLVAFAMIVEALGVVPFSLLQKSLAFRTKLIPDLGQSATKAVASIALAAAGYGVWALAAGHLVGVSVGLVLRYVVRPWKPGAPPSLRMLREMTAFGWRLLAAEMLGVLQNNLDALLIGRALGATALGVYTVATRIPFLVIRSFTMVSGLVIHPIMSDIQRDDAGLRRYYLDCLRYVSLITLPAGVAIAALAEPMTRILYTPEWYGMIPLMQCLSIAIAIQTLEYMPGLIYKAIGKPQYILRLALIKAPVYAGVLIWAVGQGIQTVAVAQIGLAVFYLVPSLIVLRRVIGLRAVESLDAIVPALAASVAVAVSILASGRIPIDIPLVELCLGGLFAAAAYLLALRLAAPEAFTEGRRILAAKLGRRLDPADPTPA